MSRLDHHISTVRNKLALGVFLEAWAQAGIALGVLVLITVIGQRLFDRWLARPGMLFWIGVAVSAAVAWGYSIFRRPSAESAAMQIDDILGLKEKYSTALYARALDDPFAQAAVRDAEQQADNVSLYKRFPLKFPRQAIGTAAIFVLAFLVALFMPTLHMFSKPPVDDKKLAENGPQPHQDQFVKDAMPTILAPAAMPDSGDKIRKATDDLNKAIHTDEGDELRNHRSVLSALQDYNKTMADEMKNNEKFQTAMEEQNQLSSIDSAKDDSTPIGKAQNELKAGNMDAAMNDISKAVKQFDKMSDADQQKAVDQAKNLAEALSNAANDPKTNQKIAQQLMQMGASQSQAQQMSSTLQQAAQGNKQAQQQMQQMAKQVAQQMNNGQGPTQQQQQQIQQMLTKSQALANSQAQAQTLSSAAQQLSAAMVQARAASQQPRSSPQNQGHPSQQGQSGSQSGSQAMAQAQQQMQQQMQQMQASAKDAQSMQAAANAAAQAAADAAAGLNGPAGGNDQADGQGGNNSGKNPNGQGGQGNGNQPGWTPNPGKGGSKMGIAMAPAAFKQELDPSKDNANGRILASRYVKAGIDPGKSTADLKSVATSAEKDAPDDIDQDRIPREAQQAEKDYFSAMQQQNGQ